MKSFSFSLLILTIILEVVCTQNKINLCQQNYGNIQIKSAFRLGSRLFFFGENGQKFKVINFKWEPSKNEFTYEGVEALDTQIWNTTDMRFTSTVDYPTKGLRILEIDQGNSDNIVQLLAYLLEVEEKSGNIKSKEEIIINLYKCDSKREPMNLCSLFEKFPQENIVDNFMSMTSFPLTNGSTARFPLRFFVYYRETPPRNKEKECTSCYESRRYLMFGKEVSDTSELNETNWQIDNSLTIPCVDLKGVIVNASMTLTDYIPNGQLFDFYLIEFSGTNYTIFRIQISSDLKVLKSFDKHKSGLIGEFFNCKQPPPTTPPPLTTQQITKSSSQQLPRPETQEGLKPPETQEGVRPPEIEEGLRATSEAQEETSNTNSPKNSSLFLLIVIIIAAVFFILAIIGVIAWFFIPRGRKSPPQPPPASPPPPPPAADPPNATENETQQ